MAGGLGGLGGPGGTAGGLGGTVGGPGGRPVDPLPLDLGRRGWDPQEKQDLWQKR